ncbi:unnamed protein product, partial [Polarella glacialis]
QQQLRHIACARSADPSFCQSEMLRPGRGVILGLCAASFAMLPVTGRPGYVASVPNGANIPGHRGLGHENAEGQGALNQFGRDFMAAGKKWTKELCEKDSDRDGRSNGEELGDPRCVWKKAVLSDASGRKKQEPPDITAGITHPGVPDGVFGKIRALTGRVLGSMGVGEL